MNNISSEADQAVLSESELRSYKAERRRLRSPALLTSDASLT
eukprot:CAMPEP_0185826242 /NCGR_PEP_ID=MMETSP1322-20130828/31449_1 /TAXON_ID=265543 /ORGANISM="Minutocellus polymorphus, Strain RCC2270" /LENGTH=41 /DNA_ID= /DNA_START= /DNA_END= /DNA_ORIENTATION=